MDGVFSYIYICFPVLDAQKKRRTVLIFCFEKNQYLPTGFVLYYISIPAPYFIKKKISPSGGRISKKEAAVLAELDSMSQEGLPISCNLSSASTPALFFFHHHHHHQKCCYQSDLTFLPQHCSSSELSRPCRRLPLIVVFFSAHSLPPFLCFLQNS